MPPFIPKAGVESGEWRAIWGIVLAKLNGKVALKPPLAFATRALIQRAEKVCKLWCDSRYKEGIRSGFFVVLFFPSLALTFIKHRGVIVHRHQTISRMHLMAERISCENLDLKAFASL